MIGQYFYPYKKKKLPVESINSEYKAGVNIKEICEKYGFSRYLVRDRLAKAGIEIRRKDYTKKPLPMKDIISKYKSGVNIKELCEKYGVSRPTLRGRLIEAGIEIRRSVKKGRYNNYINLQMESIISEYKSGVSIKALCVKYGVSYSTIYSRLKEAGVIRSKCKSF